MTSVPNTGSLTNDSAGSIPYFGGLRKQKAFILTTWQEHIHLKHPLSKYASTQDMFMYFIAFLTSWAKITASDNVPDT